jgi:hypothetical protein
VGVDVGGGECVLEVSPTATQGRVPECPNIAARNEESRETRKVRAMDDTEVGKSGGHHGFENVLGAGTERSAGGEREGTLQRWFDMIDWQGVGIKEEQQAQGGMRFYVRGQTRTK